MRSSQVMLSVENNQKSVILTTEGHQKYGFVSQESQSEYLSTREMISFSENKKALIKEKQKRERTGKNFIGTSSQDSCKEKADANLESCENLKFKKLV